MAAEKRYKPKPYIDVRSWGTENRFSYNVKSTVKILNVKKGEHLSIQYHNRRDEYWYVISGKARILLGKKWTLASPGDGFFIPRKKVHTAEGLEGDARVLEISFGRFDQEDIVRLEDRCRRK